MLERGDLPLWLWAKFEYYKRKGLSMPLEGRGEQVFLRGNVFLARIAKSVFERDGEIFADACGKYKDEAYFRECARTLGKLDFVVDEKLTKGSWRALYEIVLLLTSEYLATKCELPKTSAFECSDNSESAETLEIIVARQGSVEADLCGAALSPIKVGGLYGSSRLDDSSDSIKVGERFYEFLGENFPFRGSKEDFAGFMGSIYGEDVCKDLGWLYEAVASNSLPRPETKIDAMEEKDMLGFHEGETIYLNQRLVLDAISSKNHGDSFILLIAMLLEYGHFLNHILRGKADQPAGDSKNVGRAFAYSFMEYSEADLFNADFEFADFIATDTKGMAQIFMAKVSGLNYEQRINSFYTLDSLKVWEGEV
jgi:hypothetical protein